MAEEGAQGREDEALAAALGGGVEGLVIDLVGEQRIDCYGGEGLSRGGLGEGWDFIGPKYNKSSPCQSQTYEDVADVLGRRKRVSWSWGLDVIVVFQCRETCWASKRVLMSTYWSTMSSSS